MRLYNPQVDRTSYQGQERTPEMIITPAVIRTAPNGLLI